MRSYTYPCALCGKSQVPWQINGETTILNGWISLPLKHDVCGQEITLDVKENEL